MAFFDPNVVHEFGKQLSNGALAMYMTLLAFTYGGDRTYAGLKTMADAIKSSVPSCRRWIKELVDIGLVEVNDRYRENGSRSTNLYTLRSVHFAKSKVSPVQPPPLSPVIGPEDSSPTENSPPYGGNGEDASNAAHDAEKEKKKGEVNDMMEVLEVLSEAQREKYGLSLGKPYLNGKRIGFLRGKLRAHGKDMLLRAATGWLSDKWVCDNRMCHPEYLFKTGNLERFASLSEKVARPRYRVLA